MRSWKWAGVYSRVVNKRRMTAQLKESQLAVAECKRRTARSQLLAGYAEYLWSTKYSRYLCACASACACSV
jgi:hypothetical protein